MILIRTFNREANSGYGEYNGPNAMSFYEKEEIITPKDSGPKWGLITVRILVWVLMVFAAGVLTKNMGIYVKSLYIALIMVLTAFLVARLETFMALIITMVVALMFTGMAARYFAETYGGLMAVFFLMGLAAVLGITFMLLDRHQFKCAHCGFALDENNKAEPDTVTEFRCPNCRKITVMDWTPSGPVGRKKPEYRY
ncbi:MAG: hypothetical protein GMKNLPBB_03259 [Myxococcota bacterium]|nr:hypothetical protein [Myxococcota bacterium]